LVKSRQEKRALYKKIPELFILMICLSTLNNTKQNLLLHVHGNAVNIYIADSNIGRSTIQRVHNAEFPW